MTTAIGRLATSVAAKFGVCTRKAAMRLATETGYKLVDESAKLGRGLTIEEIEKVFSQTLPKKLRPKLLGSREDVQRMFENIGYSKEVAHMQAYNPNLGGGCVPAGSGKQPIFIERGNFDFQTENSYIAHEVEHALERNNRLKAIYARKMCMPLLALKSLFNKNFIDSLGKFAEKIKKLEVYGLQAENKTATMAIEKIKPNGKEMEFVTTLSCEPTRKGIMALNGLSSEARYQTRIRSAIRKLVNPKTKGSQNNFRFKFIKHIIDGEIPAYTVQGKVQEYAYKLSDGQIATSTGTSIVYKDALKILKNERRLYLKNKLLGRLKKPSVYQTDKDLLRLLSSKEDKEIIEKMIKTMNDEQKEELFKAIRKNPKVIDNIKAFKEAMTVDGKSIYDGYLGVVADINPEILKNPDFIKIAKITEFGDPAYAFQLSKIAKASPEKIKQFAQIADEKVLVDGQYERLKYHALSNCLESPKFDSLKKITDINLEYENYICDMNHLLTGEQIDLILKEAIEASKKGNLIIEKIERIIKEAAEQKFSFVKAEQTKENFKNIF